jgi:hypothetical protein
MSQGPDQSDSESPKRGGLLDELQALIQSLQSLATEMASRLLASRMRAAARASTPRESVPIGDLLADYIAPTPAPSAPVAQLPVQEEQATADKEASTADTPAPEPAPKERVAATLFNPFSEHLNRQHSATDQHPHVRDEMREHTFSHLNKALSQARQGNAHGAKLYAGLAENAMRQAGQYMSDDEYAQFRAEVEERLHSASR